MKSYQFLKPRVLVVVSLVVLLALAVACGDDVAVPTPQPTATPIDVASITSQIQQAVQDTLKDVTAGAVTKADIDNAVATAISAIPDPPAAVSAQEIQTMVSAAVTAAIPAEASADEIRKLVTDAVAAASAGAVTQQDVADAITKAVADASAGAVTKADITKALADAAAAAPDPLSEADIQNIVKAALPTATPTPMAMAPGPEGTLNIGIKELGPYSSSPRLTISDVWIHVGNTSHESLISTDVSGAYHSKILSEWSVDSSGVVWTMKLNEGIEFHKGWGELTADDVIWTMQDIVAEGGVSALAGSTKRLWAAEDGSATAVDSHTIEVDTGTPQFDMRVYGMSVPFVGAIVSKKNFEDEGEEAAMFQGIGSGPWEFAETSVGEFWKFTAVEGHYRKTPDFAELILWDIPEESVRVANFQTGRLDSFNMEFDSKPVLDQVIGVKYMAVPGGATEHLGIYGNWYVGLGDADHAENRPGYDASLPWVSASADINSQEWEDARKVRFALNIAIDRQLIVDTILGGEGEPQSAWLWEGQMHRLDPDIRHYEFNPTLAQQMIADAGYPNGFEIEITPSIRGVAGEVDACEAVAEMWEDIGLTVSINRVPFETIQGLVVTRDYNGAVCQGTGGRADPLDAWPIVYSSTSPFTAGGDHPILDALVDEALVIRDDTLRFQKMNEVARFVFENALDAGLYVVNVLWPLSAKVESWQDKLEAGDRRALSGYEWATHR